MIIPIFFAGTLERCIKATGIKTKPAEKIRTDAICHPFSSRLLNFIRIKELPQIKESTINMIQLINLSFSIEGQMCYEYFLPANFLL